MVIITMLSNGFTKMLQILVSLLSNSKKLLEQYITGYDTNSVMQFWLFHNGQALMLVLYKNLAVVLEVLMTLPWEKLVEFPVYQFVPIQMNVSVGMEFI